MKERSKYVLEGAIVELLSNEYDRILAVNDMEVNIDSQKYLGSVTEDEAKNCSDILSRVKELKNNEIILLQTLARNMFAYERPARAEAPIEGQMEISELDKEKAMKGVETFKVEEVSSAEVSEDKEEE